MLFNEQFTVSNLIISLEALYLLFSWTPSLQIIKDFHGDAPSIKICICWAYCNSRKEDFFNWISHGF